MVNTCNLGVRDAKGLNMDKYYKQLVDKDTLEEKLHKQKHDFEQTIAKKLDVLTEDFLCLFNTHHQ